MAVCNIYDLKTLIKPSECLLGLDLGSVVMGVSISDPTLKVASPLVGIMRGKLAADLAKLAEIVNERNIGGFVIGLPKNLDGTEGPAAQSARAFASNLLRHGKFSRKDMPIVFWDERFSTAAVTRFMINDDMTRKRRNETIDKAAAAYILQGALDAINNGKQDIL